jgi:hypothetical protein
MVDVISLASCGLNQSRSVRRYAIVSNDQFGKFVCSGPVVENIQLRDGHRYPAWLGCSSFLAHVPLPMLLQSHEAP